MGFLDFLADVEITHAPLSSTSKATGDPTYGTQSTYSVHYTEGAEITRDEDGKVINIDGRIVAEGAPEFATTDAIWLPGADTTDDGDAIEPKAVGKDAAGGLTIYWAEL